jgi:hypothetical protein
VNIHLEAKRADNARRPTDARTDQGRLSIRMNLQNLCQIRIESVGDKTTALAQKLLQLIGAKSELTKIGKNALTTH